MSAQLPDRTITGLNLWAKVHGVPEMQKAKTSHALKQMFTERERSKKHFDSKGMKDLSLLFDDIEPKDRLPNRELVRQVKNLQKALGDLSDEVIVLIDEEHRKLFHQTKRYLWFIVYRLQIMKVLELVIDLLRKNAGGKKPTFEHRSNLVFCLAENFVLITNSSPSSALGSCFDDLVRIMFEMFDENYSIADQEKVILDGVGHWKIQQNEAFGEGDIISLYREEMKTSTSPDTQYYLS